MEKIDQLIEKFKEAKEELQKTDEKDLTKAYISSYSKWGPTKKVKPVEKPAVPSVAADDQAREKPMGTPTNPDKKPVIKAEEDRDSRWEKKMERFNKAKELPTIQQFTGAGLTHPSDMTRAHAYVSAQSGDYAAPKAPAVPAKAAKPAPAKKLTGLDRIKAESQKPLGKTVGGPNVGEAMSMSCGEKLSLNKGGQWDLSKSDSTGVVRAPKDLSRVHDAPAAVSTPKITPQPVTPAGLAHRGTVAHRGGDTVISPAGTVAHPVNTAPKKTAPDPFTLAAEQEQSGRKFSDKVAPPPAVRPVTPAILNPSSRTGLDRIRAESKRPISPTVVNATKKTEEDGRNDKAECEKCHAKQCQCNKTGILLDKTVNVSSAGAVGTPDDSI